MTRWRNRSAGTVAWAATLAVALGATAPAGASCAADAQHLCLQGDRFRVGVDWRTSDANGAATAVPLTDEAGLFWFFAPGNIEMLVKVLDGCAFNQRYWVFAAATTNVETTLIVTDTVASTSRTYRNPLGVAALPIQDTAAFATCSAAGAAATRFALGGFKIDPEASVSQPTLAAAKTLGADLVRATPNLGWVGAQPALGGPYVWQSDPAGNAPDAVVRLAEDSGLDTLRILNSGRPEDPGKPPSAKDPSSNFLLSPDLRDGYQAFVRATVERYDGDGKGDMPGLTRPLELWSYTPEAGTYFEPQGDAAGFLQMFNLTADAVHQADPAARIVLPLNTQGTYIAAFAGGYLARTTITVKGRTYTRGQAQSELAANIQFTTGLVTGADADLFDLHFYGDAESIPGRVAWLRDTLSHAGRPVRPVISMEGGEPFSGLGESFPTGPATCGGGPVSENPNRLSFQSGALLRHVALAALAGAEIVTFNLGPEYGDFGSGFGDLDLWNACRQPRPAFWTYAAARDMLAGFSAASDDGTIAGVRLVRFAFAAPRSPVWVAWDPTGASGVRNLAAVLGTGNVLVTHAVTAAGQVSPVVTNESSLAVAVGSLPVLLQTASP